MAIKVTITEMASGCDVLVVAADNQMLLNINECLLFCSSLKNSLSVLYSLKGCC